MTRIKPKVKTQLFPQATKNRMKSILDSHHIDLCSSFEKYQLLFPNTFENFLMIFLEEYSIILYPLNPKI